jgi:hypothetical protein
VLVGVPHDCRGSAVADIRPQRSASCRSRRQDQRELPAAGLLPPAIDPLGRNPIEAQHGGAIVLGIASILEILGASIERHQLIEQPVVGRQLDHRVAGPVSANDIAGLEHMVQQGACLGTGSSGRAVTSIGLRLLDVDSTVATKS